MEFVDENAERFLEGTTPVLEITGAVRNFTRQTREAPLIEVRLLDDAGVQIGAAFEHGLQPLRTHLFQSQPGHVV